MRRLPFGGTGLFVIAAAALPIIIKSSKPLAKKIGEAIEKMGQKLKEASEEETANKHKGADRPEPKIPDSPEPESPNPRATKVRQTKPAPKANSKPRPKKTVKSSPAKPTTAAKKPVTKPETTEN